MRDNVHRNPRFIRTLRDDVAQGGFFADLMREAREVEEFYLNDEEREQLKGKGKFWRWFVLAWWVVKNSLYKLTSVRRILLVVGLFLLISDISYRATGSHVTFEYKIFGVFFLLLVIILELKDKLLAHSELESGRAVQRAMSPDPTPVVPGWSIWLYTRSANEVGGDLVDFLRLDDGRFGVALGDVAGKGLGAALFMVKIQSTLRALAPDTESLSNLASKLNSILIRDGMPGKFASLIFARINSVTGDVQMINAGHMPPLSVSPKGVAELLKGNAALGLSKDTLFEARDVKIIGGHTLVIYSDGVTEAQNEAGEFYGLERFKAVCLQCRSVAPATFGERILAEVSAFEGAARRSDDLSLVILQKLA